MLILARHAVHAVQILARHAGHAVAQTEGCNLHAVSCMPSAVGIAMPSAKSICTDGFNHRYITAPDRVNFRPAVPSSLFHIVLSKAKD